MALFFIAKQRLIIILIKMRRAGKFQVLNYNRGSHFYSRHLHETVKSLWQLHT